MPGICRMDIESSFLPGWARGQSSGVFTVISTLLTHGAFCCVLFYFGEGDEAGVLVIWWLDRIKCCEFLRCVLFTWIWTLLFRTTRVRSWDPVTFGKCGKREWSRETLWGCVILRETFWSPMKKDAAKLIRRVISANVYLLHKNVLAPEGQNTFLLNSRHLSALKSFNFQKG